MISMEKEQKISKLWYLSPISAIVGLFLLNTGASISFFPLWIIWTGGVWDYLKKRDREVARNIAILNMVAWTIAFFILLNALL